MMDCERGKINIIKKSSQKYLLLQTDHLRFIDVCAWFPNISLANFLRSYGTKAEKEEICNFYKQKFPYTTFASFESFDLPLSELTVENFNNDLKQSNTLLDEWVEYVNLLNSNKTSEQALAVLGLSTVPSDDPRSILRELKAQWNRDKINTLAELCEFYCRSDCL